MDCLLLSFGFNKKYPNFGYELNKINNYIMASKPLIVIGEKKNHITFYKMLNLIKLKYKYFTKIAIRNKKKLYLRNNPGLIFKETVKHINNL